MKVALISPPYPLDESPSPPLGICYVASAFEEAGANVRIFDFIVRKYTPEKLKKEIDVFGPDIVGINSVTMNFPVAAGILETAKRHRPSIITMFGGPHVTFDIDDTLKQYPGIDIVAVGEGEQTIKELLPVISKREEWDSVKGIAFLRDGEVVRTAPRPFIQNLDSIPVPARHLLPMSRYLALGFPVSIITSRGCPNQCIFCQGRRMVGQKVRYRNPVLIVDEIEQILSYGFQRINIADDFFTSNKKRVKLVCNEIMRRGVRFQWSAFARVDSVDKESLKIMMEAGCDTVSFGIESGNEEMLRRVRKRITKDQARKAVQDCKEVGMKIFASFMVGLPGESKQTLSDSHSFAKELDIDHGYHFLAPFPGTTLRENIETYDLEILTNDWSLYDANRAIVRTSHLTPKDIEDFVDVYYGMCKKELDRMEREYREGTASEYDIYRIEGKRKMEFIFQLLSEDIIESVASYSVQNDSVDTITSMLLERILEVVDSEEKVVRNAIDRLISAGYLKYRIKEGIVCWYWTHNNTTDILDPLMDL